MTSASAPLIKPPETPLVRITGGNMVMVVAVLLALAMLVLPLPALLLDLLFTFNIALALVVLLAVFSAQRPMDFSVFPSVLLVATLLRLALSVASARVVLVNGHEGSHAAGKVIEAFGNFVIAGNTAVGVIVFLILTVINFMVVTKGAERASEVSARFVLDALPGRQMAIDADLNAQSINRETAKALREELRGEADFYGSLDGTAKFIRGDALATLLIVFVNIIGGLIIGIGQHDLPIATALSNYTLLTIGDGLVAQIPALLMATALALLVSRRSAAADLSQQTRTQLWGKASVLTVAATVIGILGLIPGMPHLAFLTLAALMLWAAKRLQKQQKVQEVLIEASALQAPIAEPAVEWQELVPEGGLRLEVGYRLAGLLDASHPGNLLSRIQAARQRITEDLGFRFGAVHLSDNLDLPPNEYRIRLRGVPLAQGRVMPDRELAINPGRAFGKLEGIAARASVLGLDGMWIPLEQRDQAVGQGYTVLDAATVIATHVTQVVQEHAESLLGFEEAQDLLNALARVAPNLAHELIPKTLSLALFTKVLKGLVSESVPVRDLTGIAEALVTLPAGTKDPDVMIQAVRVALGGQIIHEIQRSNPKMRRRLDVDLPVINLSSELEQDLLSLVKQGVLVLSAKEREAMHQQIQQFIAQQHAKGEALALVVAAELRQPFVRLLRPSFSRLYILSTDELPQAQKLRISGTLMGWRS